MANGNPFAALEALKGQVPKENKKPTQRKTKKSKSWNLSMAKVPLQVLKLDDLEIRQSDGRTVYSDVLEWQASLNSLLDIPSSDRRIQTVEDLFQQSEGEFKSILKRLQKAFTKRRNISVRDANDLLLKEISGLDDRRSQAVLKAAEDADSQQWEPLYDGLCSRIEMLACSIGKGDKRRKAIVEVEYDWQVRVGGVSGFRERLIPAMHPVYGIPYVPASTLKGILRAWVRQQGDIEQKAADRILGYLCEAKAQTAAVEVFDAFPTGPSLRVDIATPQWEWQGDHVIYGPSPHSMLSLSQPSLKIGLTYTSCGSEADVETAVGWLERALAESSLGARASAGYGGAVRIGDKDIEPESSRYQKIYPFKLWSQGVYGAQPSTNREGTDGLREFRPTALRGILRYWFRAIALRYYSPETCQKLEAEVFGAIKPRAVAGKVTVQVNVSSENTDETDQPYEVVGDIILKSRSPQYLALAEKLLVLAVHLGGVGGGSRRPLHYNSGRFRGCYWELTRKPAIANSLTAWREFLSGFEQSLENLPATVQRVRKPGEGSPGDVGKGRRLQDVLNKSSQIILVSNPGLVHPKDVKNWETNGKKPKVRGRALELLYSSAFHGEEKVSGNLGTPSFVTVQSNFPSDGDPYQVVTVFGADNAQRQRFISALKEAYSDRVVPW